MSKRADILEKLSCLGLLHDKGEQAARRVYPELSAFIDQVKDKRFEEVKESLEQQLYTTNPR